MNKQSLLSETHQIIEDANHKITILNEIEPGYLYRYTVYEQTFIGRLVTLNRLSVRFHQIAGTEPVSLQGYNDTWGYNAIRTLKKVTREELPLYAGWPFLSSEFAALLKGTSRLRIKFP